MQDIISVFTFKEIFELLVGVLIFVYAFYQVYTLLSTQCWAEVTNPMKEIFTQSLRPGGTVEIKMDPNCLNRTVITKDPGKCRDACENDRECIKKCTGTGKVFIVMVQKREERGWFARSPARWVIRPLQTIREEAFQHNEVFAVICNLVDEQDPIVCEPGRKAKMITLKFEGDEQRCYVGREMRLPPLCKPPEQRRNA